MKCASETVAPISIALSFYTSYAAHVLLASSRSICSNITRNDPILRKFRNIFVGYG